MRRICGLVDVEKAQHWNSRGHFFAAAAEAMRRILVDNARQKPRPKHGGDCNRVELDDACGIAAPEPTTICSPSTKRLAQLAEDDRQSAELVKLRYFAGLTIPQAADVLGISPRNRRPALGLRHGLAVTSCDCEKPAIG